MKTKDKNIKYQYECFENHIQASLETNLPLIIHQRNSEKEIIEILTNYKKYNLKLVMHCFTGSKKLRDFCIDSNYYISLTIPHINNVWLPLRSNVKYI